MSNDISFSHGAVLARIVNYKECCINKIESCQSAYLINKSIALYIKCSFKRITPWYFSFNKWHTKEITEMHSNYLNFYIVLVCFYDGMACIDFVKYQQIINSEISSSSKWVKASRKKNEKYSVSGSDGKLKNKISDSSFPSNIFLFQK